MKTPVSSKPLSTNVHLLRWVKKMAALQHPRRAILPAGLLAGQVTGDAAAQMPARFLQVFAATRPSVSPASNSCCAHDQFAAHAGREMNPLTAYIMTLLPILTAAFCGTTVFAAELVTDPSELTLARIFTGKEFQEEKMERLKWSKRGSHYFALEKQDGLNAIKASEDVSHEQSEERGIKTLVRYDAESGVRTILASPEVLTPAGKKSPLTVDSFAFSADETKVLLFANTRKVWRENTRGDYWLLDLATKHFHKLGGDGLA